ncbi:MAG: hypothetical protein JXB48_02765 [Candidatus Latescibacteria bacterium]|nr:hypothetical protein [Candidatus Latescibacterota bacterium]
MHYDRIEHTKRAYIYSGLFHAALFLLMLNVTVFFEVEPPEFYELNLGAVSQERLGQIIDEARRSEAARRLQAEGRTPEERVEVPDRKMIEIEEPTISVPEAQRIESRLFISNAEKQKIEVDQPAFDVPVMRDDTFSMDRKQSFEGTKIDVGEQPGAGIETGTIGKEFANFEIEGEIKGRDIMSNPLPEYPEGLNKNARIKISFVVFPNGTVSPTDMFPVRKENAVLEELAMEKLKLWKFSSLPSGQTQNQRGFITFEFKVK